MLESDGTINWRLTPSNGFVLDQNGNPMYAVKIPEVGQVVDRYGSGYGKYVCPVVDGKSYSYSQRSLPYLQDPRQYHQYVVTGDFMQIEQYVNDCKDIGLRTEIQNRVSTTYGGDYYKLLPLKGPVAGVEGWGIGGAEQWKFNLSINDLMQLGLLKQIR